MSRRGGYGGAVRRARRVAWRAQRDLGDVSAALDGPGAYARRRVRARAYRHTSRGLAALLRAAGLR